MAALTGGWHPERMSLTTDGLALGAAAAVAFGSAVQASQAYTDLNENTPARDTLGPLAMAVIKAVTMAVINPLLDILLNLVDIPSGSTDVFSLFLSLGLVAKVPGELTLEQVAALPPRQAAVLADGKTALTADQKKARADGQPIELTDDQAAAIDAKRVQDVKKWLSWLLGWIFILIGALAAVIGAAVTLANDL
jgi:hypothetical protein